MGRLLFGRRCRLTLALWIVRHDKPCFYQSEPPREVISQGHAGKELGQLVRLGMLEEERPDDSRRVYYHRTDSPLWKIIEAAADVVARGLPEASGRGPAALCPVLLRSIKGTSRTTTASSLKPAGLPPTLPSCPVTEAVERAPLAPPGAVCAGR